MHVRRQRDSETARQRDSGLSARRAELDALLVELVTTDEVSIRSIEIRQEAALILLEAWDHDRAVPMDSDCRRALETAKGRLRRTRRRWPQPRADESIEFRSSADPSAWVSSKEALERVLAFARTWPPEHRRFFLDVALGNAKLGDVGEYRLGGLHDRRQGRRLWHRLRENIRRTLEE